MKALPCAKKQLAPLDCDNAWRGHVTFTLTSPNSKTARHRVFNVQRARNLDANCNGRAYFVRTPWQWADKNCNRTSVFHIWMYWGTLQRRSLLQNNSILWWRWCPPMDPGRAPTRIILRSLLKSFCMHVNIVEARIFFSPSHLSPKHK